MTPSIDQRPIGFATINEGTSERSLLERRTMALC